MNSKVCPVCKIKFIHSDRRKKFCSIKCKTEGAKEYNKKYNQSDNYKKSKKKWIKSQKGKEYLKKYSQTETFKEYQKKYKKLVRDRAKGVLEITCLKCNIKFIHSDRRKKFCSIKCKTEGAKEYNKKYRKTDKFKKSLRRYRTSDKGKAADKRTYETRKKNGKFQMWQSKYEKERRKSDPEFKLKSSMRKRLYIFLKSSNMKKTNKTFKMIGCTPKFLKEYLEKKFKPGMTWDNHTINGWHVDHQIPLDSAKNEEELEKLMHYTNLQPMWAVDNIKKSNKII